ncbi:MAG: hypothetical protein U9O82_11980 [Thermodesulfobacteriota bacterium]|nr:hypothetical protein [Thermodesulfobacteriota bacterium]
MKKSENYKTVLASSKALSEKKQKKSNFIKRYLEWIARSVEKSKKDPKLCPS